MYAIQFSLQRTVGRGALPTRLAGFPGRTRSVRKGRRRGYCPSLTSFYCLTQGKWEGCLHFTALLAMLVLPHESEPCSLRLTKRSGRAAGRRYHRSRGDTGARVR